MPYRSVNIEKRKLNKVSLTISLTFCLEVLSALHVWKGSQTEQGILLISRDRLKFGNAM